MEPVSGDSAIPPSQITPSYVQPTTGDKLANWSDNFYLSIAESNFTQDLHKFQGIFQQLSIIIDLGKNGLLTQDDESDTLNSLNDLQRQWRGNALNLKSCQKQLSSIVRGLTNSDPKYLISSQITQIGFLFKLHSNDETPLIETNEFNQLTTPILDKIKNSSSSNLEISHLSKGLDRVIDILDTPEPLSVSLAVENLKLI